MASGVLRYSFIGLIMLLFGQCKTKPEDIGKPVISTMLSFTANPSGNWQVGYSAGNLLDTTQFRLCTFADADQLVNVWHPAAGGYYPYTGQNNTSSTQLDATGSWAARPGEVVMEGSNTGQHSMLRFVAPMAGKYKIRVVFEGVHFRISTTDVHVLLNAQSLFADSINGYGGDSTAHAIQGPRPTTTYNDTLQLQKEDIVTFAVGYGSDNTNYNDTTGLLIYIEVVA